MTCCRLTGSYLPKLVQFSLIFSSSVVLSSVLCPSSSSFVLVCVVSVDDPAGHSVDEVVGGQVGGVPGPAAQSVRDGVGGCVRVVRPDQVRHKVPEIIDLNRVEIVECNDLRI